MWPSRAPCTQKWHCWQRLCHPPHCNLHIFVARILLIVLIVLRYQYIDSAGTIAVCSRPDIGIAANTPSALRPTSLGGPIICSWSVSYNAPLGPPPFLILQCLCDTNLLCAAPFSQHPKFIGTSPHFRSRTVAVFTVCPLSHIAIPPLGARLRRSVNSHNVPFYILFKSGQYPARARSAVDYPLPHPRLSPN